MATFVHSIPFLPVKDLKETIRFYVTKLGFKDEWYWGNPPTDAGCCRDQLSLLFNLNPELAEKTRGVEIVFVVKGVDEVYREALNNGIDIISDIENKPWGMREFTVKDPDGYYLRISEEIQV